MGGTYNLGVRASLLRQPTVGALATIVATAAMIALLAPFREDVGLLNETMLFLLATLIVSATWGLHVGLFAAVLTNVALNFFFIITLPLATQRALRT